MQIQMLRDMIFDKCFMASQNMKNASEQQQIKIIIQPCAFRKGSGQNWKFGY